MAYTKKNFGSLINKQQVFIHTISNEFISCSISEYGACITSLIVKDKNNNKVDVVAGFDNVAQYEGKCGSMGFTIGRHANRIANAEFEIDGVNYKLVKNNGENHLHGGNENCFSKKMFNINYKTVEGNESLNCYVFSPDGEEGYPGSINLNVIFTLDNNMLRIEYKANSDKKTILNLTNHSYFNLDNGDNIFDHELFVDADYITEAGVGLIPTGKVLKVDNTVFDFRKPIKLGDVLKHRLSDAQLVLGGGLDHNFCLNKKTKKDLASSLYSERSGIVMDTYTSEPGIQIYTSCTTDIKNGKCGKEYGNFCCVCLETQHYPDSVHNPNFPSILLNAGEEFYSITEYVFRTK